MEKKVNTVEEIPVDTYVKVDGVDFEKLHKRVQDLRPGYIGTASDFVRYAAGLLATPPDTDTDVKVSQKQFEKLYNRVREIYPERSGTADAFIQDAVDLLENLPCCSEHPTELGATREPDDRLEGDLRALRAFFRRGQ